MYVTKEEEEEEMESGEYLRLRMEYMPRRIAPRPVADAGHLTSIRIAQAQRDCSNGNGNGNGNNSCCDRVQSFQNVRATQGHRRSGEYRMGQLAGAAICDSPAQEIHTTQLPCPERPTSIPTAYQGTLSCPVIHRGPPHLSDPRCC